MIERRKQTLNERQDEVMSTCMDSCRNAAYPFMGLIEEVGELTEKMKAAMKFSKDLDEQEKIRMKNDLDGLIEISRRFGKRAKALRHGSIPVPFTVLPMDGDKHQLIGYEIGDVNWESSALAKMLCYTDQQIADMNHAKLLERQNKNTIDGQGDTIRRPINY